MYSFVAPTDDYDESLKILMLGDPISQKSKLLDALATSINKEEGERLGDFIYLHLFNKKTRRKIRLQIWDTIANERFRSFLGSYYQNTHGFLLVYNVSDINSFNRIHYFLLDVDRYAPYAERVIIGHECANDLNNKIIDYGTAQALEEVLSIPVFEVSVDDTSSMTKPLISLVTQIMERRERQLAINRRLNLKMEQDIKQCSSRSPSWFWTRLFVQNNATNCDRSPKWLSWLGREKKKAPTPSPPNSPCQDTGVVIKREQNQLAPSDAELLVSVYLVDPLEVLTSTPTPTQASYHNHSPSSSPSTSSSPSSNSDDIDVVTPLLTLPLELQLHAFSFLDAASLCRVSQTCKELYTMILNNQEMLWKGMLLSRFKCLSFFSFFISPLPDLPTARFSWKRAVGLLHVRKKIGLSSIRWIKALEEKTNSSGNSALYYETFTQSISKAVQTT